MSSAEPQTDTARPRFQKARAALQVLRTDATVQRRAGIVLAAVLVCGYAIGVMAYAQSVPDIGIRCAFTPVVNRFNPEFRYPPDQDPLQPYDRVIKLGDQSIQNWPEIQRYLLRAKSRVSEIPKVENPEELETTPHPFVRLNGVPIVRLDYERNGQKGVVWCRFGTSPLSSLFLTVLWFFIKAGLLLVGALFLWRCPEEGYARQFFVLCIVSCGAYLGGYHWSRIITQPVLILVFMVCAVMLPPVSLHFYLLFPRRKKLFRRSSSGWFHSALFWVYLFPVAFLLFLLYHYVEIRILMRGDVQVAGELYAMGWALRKMLIGIYIYFGIALLLYLLSIASMIHSLQVAKEETERNQVKWILFGALAALAPMGYTLYMAMTDQGRFGGGGATLPMFIASLFVTMAFAISITRYRLMQIDRLMSSGTIYVAVSVLGALVYTLVVFLLFWLGGAPAMGRPSPLGALGASATVLVLMLLHGLIQGRVKRALDRHFRKEKIQLDRTLRKMSESISQLVDSPTLARRLLQSLTELLGATRGAVYLRQEHPTLYQLSTSQGEPPTLTELPPGCPLLEALNESPLLTCPASPGEESPAVRQLRFLGGEVACELSHEGKGHALLVLGPRQHGRYNEEDLHLITAFAQVTTLALVSGEEGKAIDALNRELQLKLEKIAEQQRRILALQSQLTRRQRESTHGSEAPTKKSPPEEEPATIQDPEPPSETTEPLPPRSSREIVGSSEPVQKLLHLVEKVAISDSAVLLRGESGTGKELLAQALHARSSRANRPFVKVHCAALAPTLLESELFGHIKGAFTGAMRDRAGRFEAANGGTLFLDEIGDISLEVQTKLLRVLQEMSFERVGSSEPIHVDVRIVAATHQNLEELIRQGRFREDLFYRLNVLPLSVPSLRDRQEDIPELAQHFLEMHRLKCRKPQLQLSDDAMVALKGCPWPGNIRQLENVIERAVIIAEGEWITPEALPPEILKEEKEEAIAEGEALDAPPIVQRSIQTEREERNRKEREELVRALAATNGNKAEAARALGLARSTLVSRLKKHGLT